MRASTPRWVAWNATAWAWLPRARSDHPAPLLLFVQQQNAVERAPFFKGSGALQVIQLQINLLSGHFGERGRELAGGEVDEVANSLFCLLYLTKGNVHTRLNHFSCCS